MTVVNDGATADRLVRIASPVATGALVVADDLVIPGGRTLTAGQTGPLSAHGDRARGHLTKV